jgi:hypothetical protein
LRTESFLERELEGAWVEIDGVTLSHAVNTLRPLWMCCDTSIGTWMTQTLRIITDKIRKKSAVSVSSVFLLMTNDRSPFTIHHSPFTVHRSPFTIYRSPFTVHHSPFTIHRSPFTVHRSPFLKHIRVPAPKFIVLALGFPGPAVDAFLAGQIVAVDVPERKNEQPQHRHGDRPAEKPGKRTDEHQREHILANPAPLRGLLLKMPEADVPDGVDNADDGDFEPEGGGGGHDEFFFPCGGVWAKLENSKLLGANTFFANLG